VNGIGLERDDLAHTERCVPHERSVLEIGRGRPFFAKATGRGDASGSGEPFL
jgi:hypothetical protein